MVADGRRTQGERRRESEARLLHGAIEIIARHGTAAVTFEALGRQSGLSRGMVTQRFGSKQRLLEAVLTHLHDSEEAWLAASPIAGLGGREAIVAYIDTCLCRIARTSDARAYFLLLSSSLEGEPEFRAIFRRRHAEFGARIEAWIRAAQAEGSIGMAVDAAPAALMIGCLVFGLSMQMIVDPETDVRAVRGTIVQVLDLGLGGARPA